ncbi:MAG: hypothetical protein JSS32_01895 [Verrucomicrobia bacterium]|nr:hypothetical protein [Verrucomicrobiota bacterium]
MNGIVVASDLKSEWLLPWWWKFYSLHNNFPVAFCDFGMSEKALNWCKERGTIYPLPSQGSFMKTISSGKKKKWENRFGEGIWHFRSAWFKKPLALLNAPFDLNCWLDLDCQVMGNLQTLFDSLPSHAEAALAKEPSDVQEKDQNQSFNLPGEITYNSGVIVFRRNSKFLSKWAEAAIQQNDSFVGDQNVLSRIIYLHDTQIAELDSRFNWFKRSGPNPDALIIHYIAGWKLEILNALSQN